MNIKKNINEFMQDGGLTSFDFTNNPKNIKRDVKKGIINHHEKIIQLIEEFPEIDYLSYSSGDQGDKGSIQLRIGNFSRSEIKQCEICKQPATYLDRGSYGYCTEHFQQYFNQKIINNYEIAKSSNLSMMQRLEKLNSIFPILNITGGGGRFGSWFWITLDGISVYDYYYYSNGKPKDESLGGIL